MEDSAMLKKFFIVVLSFVVLIFFLWCLNTEAQSVKDGLVSYWSFDKSSIDGKKVKDSVGNNDGEMKGDPKSVEGKVGDALEFNGASDSVEVPANDNLNFGVGDFTISAWVKTKAVTGRWAQRQDIVGKGDPSVSGYALSADTNKGFFWVGGAGEFTGTTDINDDKWHFVVGVRRGDQCFVYTDAKQEGKGTNAESIDTTVGVIFGKHPLKAESFFAGSIDEVGIYNRALSDDEINTSYEAKGAAVDPSGKLGLTWAKIKILEF